MEITTKNATKFLFFEPDNSLEVLEICVVCHLFGSITTTICVPNAFIYPLFYQMLNKSRGKIYFIVIFVT